MTADLAPCWAGLGIQRGDRVVLIVVDEREFAIAFLSVLRAGVVAVPMFPPVILGQLGAYYTALRKVCKVSGPARCLVSQPHRAGTVADLAYVLARFTMPAYG